MYEPRVYRDLFKGRNLVFFNCTVKETDVQVGAIKPLEKEVLSSVLRYRAEIEAYILAHPEFLTSLSPLEPGARATPIVRRMCLAGERAGVGPMAAVAGAISEFVGRDMLAYTPEIVVENGGDIFIKSNTTRKVGIYAGSSPLSQKLAIEVAPHDTPLGICTSSGTVGHSLSFGRSDATVILSEDTVLADAAATAAGNMVHDECDLKKAVLFASKISGIKSALVIMGDKMSVWGDIKLVAF